MPVQAETSEPLLIPLKLIMEGCATQEEMNRNVAASIERGYERFNEHLGKHSGEVSIVGAGPSIRETYRELRGDVLAINSAIGFLLDNGVVPRFAMLWDAHELVASFAVPHPDIIYFVAARCHPKVFERLKGCRIVCWHAGGDHNIAAYLAENKIEEPMVNGGSAGVTRAMFLSVALGYRSLHIYGADSAYNERGETHVNGSVVPEKAFAIWVGKDEGRRRFIATPEWCAQVEEYRTIYSMFAKVGISMNVYGEGMLPHLHGILKAQQEAGILEQSMQGLNG